MKERGNYGEMFSISFPAHSRFRAIDGPRDSCDAAGGRRGGGDEVIIIRLL